MVDVVQYTTLTGLQRWSNLGMITSVGMHCGKSTGIDEGLGISRMSINKLGLSIGSYAGVNSVSMSTHWKNCALLPHASFGSLLINH